MGPYRYDLHVHTNEVSGCGEVPGRKVAQLYKEAGYDGIVVTDHFCAEFFTGLAGCSWAEKIDRFFRGYHTAAATGDEIGLLVLPGLELRFAGEVEDYLIYGVDPAFLARSPWLLDANLKELHTAARAEGFLVYQAHPFRSGLRCADPGLLDGIEVYNGNPRNNSHNHLAFRFAAAHGLRMIAGSDFHQPEDLGRGGILVGVEIGSNDDLVTLLRADRIEGLIGPTDARTRAVLA